MEDLDDIKGKLMGQARSRSLRAMLAFACGVVAIVASQAIAQEPSSATLGELPAAGQPVQIPDPVARLGDYITPERITGTLSTLLLFSALSLAPALLLMTTSYVRIGIVLAILRQSLGTQGVPSNQVLAALALFMTAAIMSPVWNEIHRSALSPYQAGEISQQEAFSRATLPVRSFMARQIERTGNAADVWLFLERSGRDTSKVETYDQVPLQVLAPAFLLSELKTAFLIGFQIYLPFLVIDLVVSSVLAGIGLVTVPPTAVTFPAKLLLFVLVDGWHLVVGTLLDSFV